jgi:hypothetical protein
VKDGPGSAGLRPRLVTYLHFGFGFRILLAAGAENILATDRSTSTRNRSWRALVRATTA